MKPRVIFKDGHMFIPKCKDPIIIEDNHCVVFECCCKNRYIRQTSKYLGTRIKELIPKCVENYLKLEPETIKTAIKNTIE